MRKQYYLYILASKKNGTLYVGMTNDLVRRIQEHHSRAIKGFTEKYMVHRLVYYEVYDSPEEAIRSEKNIKAWQRAWKIRLIETVNPSWQDISNDLF